MALLPLCMCAVFAASLPYARAIQNEQVPVVDAAALNGRIAAELRMQTFKQIPGPNPILRPSNDSKAWDNYELELAGGVFKDYNTYYMLYHATSDHGGGGCTKHGDNSGYQVAC